VISAHREENIEVNLNFRKIINILDKLSIEYKLPIIVSTHPRTQKN
jgi:UDP-N-acetylglucosamine 2-epimerase